MRGLPGSGKSTLAKLLVEGSNAPVFSIDDFFYDENGNYSFDFKRNHEAYAHCESRTREAMQSAMEKIFIDNAFTIEWEMEPYYKLAKEFEYVVHVMTVEHRHDGKNAHKISDEQIERMRAKYKIVL